MPKLTEKAIRYERTDVWTELNYIENLFFLNYRMIRQSLDTKLITSKGNYLRLY